MPADSIHCEAAGTLSHERLIEALHYDPETGAFTWRIAPGRRVRIGSRAGHNDESRGYVDIRLDGKKYRAHRLAYLYVTGGWPPHEIDHINGDKRDNRLTNLRAATRQQNQFNKPAIKKTVCGVAGVYNPNGGGKWSASITVAGKLLSLGRFSSQKLAAKARKMAEGLIFGEFAPSRSRDQQPKISTDRSSIPPHRAAPARPAEG